MNLTHVSIPNRQGQMIWRSKSQKQTLVSIPNRQGQIYFGGKTCTFKLFQFLIGKVK